MQTFFAEGEKKAPELRYRPLTVDPDAAKRDLYAVDLTVLEDPLLERLLADPSVTDVLVKQRKALDEVLSAAPTALSNLFHTYNPNTGTLDTRSNMGENVAALEENPALVVCSIIYQTPVRDSLCDEIAGDGARRAAALGGPGGASDEVVQVENVDRSLAGILEVER